MGRIRYKFINGKRDAFLETVFLSEIGVSSQKELARNIGLHEKTLSRILNGHVNLSVNTAKKIHGIVPTFEFSELFIRIL